MFKGLCVDLGTGLGLSISHKYVELMGGHLAVKSELAKGTCFSFELDMPYAMDKVLIDSSSGKLVRHLAAEHHVLALIADDRKLNRDVMSTLLQSIGVKTIEAANGQETVDKAFQYKPDIIFSDYRMPLMNGDEAIRQIKANFENKIKTILVSASVFNHEKKVITQSCCDRFVLKPYLAEDIFACLHDFLNVEFVYDENHEEVEIEPEILNIRNLPDQVLSDLKNYAECYRITNLEEVIETIAELGDEFMPMAEMLKKLVESDDMDSVLELVKKSQALM
jgi:CheY-like chemotaxis protein